VADAFRLLTDDEVRQIGLIIESLDRSTFDFLQLEVGNVKLTIGKGQPPAAVADPQVAVAPAAPAPPPANAACAPPVAPAPAAAPATKSRAAEADGPAIVAPLLGRFYAQPEPGAPAFVMLGTQVTEDTTVGLIEVMKTFNAVRAGINGVITEVCVQDAQLVEYGDVLFRVQPAA
jgi:acetyl-CoA carboxylase biotin carboxyl carrier protein